MSTLLRLLDKIKSSSTASGVNPTVKQAVANSQNKSKSRDRFTKLILLSLVAILLGGAVLYYIEFMRPAPTPVMNRRSYPEPVQAQQSSARTVVSQAVQAAPSSAKLQPVQAQNSSAKSKPAKKPSGKQEVRKGLKPRKQPILQARTHPPLPLAKSSATAINALPTPPLPETRKTVVDASTRDNLLMAAREMELKKEFNQALRLYKQAAVADPDNYRIHNNIAGISIQQGNYGEALTAAQQVLAIKPEYLPGLINMGIATARLGKDQEAIRWFTKALAAEPNHRGALFNLALLREKSGAFDAAGDLYRRLMEMGDIQGYVGLGRVDEKLQKTAEARQIYRSILSLPDAAANVKNTARERLQQLESP